MSTTRRFSGQHVSSLSVGMLALIAMVMLSSAWIGQSSQPLSAAGDLTPVDMPTIDTLLPFGATLSFTPSFTMYLPLVLKPLLEIKDSVARTTVDLPHPLMASSGNWCTWGWCSIGPRLYHEPTSDGRTLVGWTDSSGDGHVSLIGSAGLEQTFDFAALSVRGLVAHDDGKFAVLLWSSAQKVMWLSKRNADGSVIWTTNIDGSLTSFNPGIGDSRLAYGNGLYAAYFAVHGDSGWPQGHEGDQLTYVKSDGCIQPSSGWEWGCSHSMAELVSYHPTLAKFAPVCSSDCYDSKGILINDSHVVFPCDGNCGGNVSAQLGQAVVSETGWKLAFNALNRPDYPGQGIGLATVDGAFQSSYVWLTNTNGDYERDPVLARLGTSLQTDRYLVGWMTTKWRASATKRYTCFRLCILCRCLEKLSIARVRRFH